LWTDVSPCRGLACTRWTSISPIGSLTDWLTHRRKADALEHAAARYRALYKQAPTVAYREAYARLTGVELPPGPPLPSASESAESAPVEVDADELLSKVDQAARSWS
jgi:hypothetical protein